LDLWTRGAMRARSMRKTFAANEDFGAAGFRIAKIGCRPSGDDEHVAAPPLTPNSQKEGDATYPSTSLGAHTLTNHGKGGENQDSYVASCSSSGSKCLIGVFDGHGEQGKSVSQFACDQIAKTLFNHKDLHTNPIGALEAAYLQAQSMIERTHSFDAHHSGTTAVAVYRHRNRLFVANVGDSRAVLGCSQGGSRGGPGSLGATGAAASGGETLRAVDLSSDQRPDREDERSRILAQGGSIHPSCVPMRQTFGGPMRFVQVGPERVWDRTGRCGLCVTRSLGDLGMRPFVVANPELSERTLSPKDKLVILGSDGVWDRVGSQEAVDIAARHRDPSAAARDIVTVARQRWYAQTQGQMSDDITAVVMRLDHDTLAQNSPPPTRGSDGGQSVALPSTAPSGRRGRGAGREPVPDTIHTRPRGGIDGQALRPSGGGGGGDRLPPMAHSMRTGKGGTRRR